MMKKYYLLITAFFLMQGVIGQTSFSTKETDQQVESLMATMTLDEKIAQIEGTRLRDIMVDGKVSLEKCREHIPYGIGHFCQFSSGQELSPEELRDLVREVQNYLMTETRLKIPAIFHEEAITGFATYQATTFPQQIGMGCSWNPDLVQQNTSAISKSMREVGASFALSPMIDISRTAHWNRHQESYGEDSYLTSRMGVAFVQGLQGDDLTTGVAATVKHFAGYGTKNNSVKELYEEYLMPHEACIKVGNAKSVMPSYGTYKALPISMSPTMLDQILRKEIGFDGLVVSDYGAINMIYKKYKRAPDQMTAGAMALNAGVDIELSSPMTFPYLKEALKKGLVTEQDIDQAVKRSLTMKARLGLLVDNPAIGKDGDLDFDPASNRQLAYQSAVESIVLLKNDGILPLKKSTRKIALVGPNASTVHCLLGDYTYQAMRAFWKSAKFDELNPKLVTLKEGLESKVGRKVKIQHERGCDWSAALEATIDKDGFGDDRLSKLKMISVQDLPQPDLKRAMKIAKESDVIIAAMGENIYLNGEGRWRKGIGLPGQQEEFVKQLIATGKPVVLVLFGGRQQVIADIEKDCAAVVNAWFPGEEGGNAVADILLGNANPSGKLCVTYPRTQEKKEIDYKMGYDKNDEPQYPFGYGLSYTSYAYDNIQLSKEAQLTDDTIEVSCSITNTGKTDGTEIVQLYISPLDKNTTMKPIQLKGFQRVNLKKGESKEITFKVSPQLLAQYKNNKWVVEGGNFAIKIGASSTDIRLSASVQIKGEPLELRDGRKEFFSSTTIQNQKLNK
ncbi:glycoside hydrolase family 3 N-terminal domain-containing protein [Flammeovirga sp. SJP92]|uniref:glycoside hydrolase family 3 N-terminal domain-containing protein n=1 Tax=Flammeovirga sp. SJP92 TaxID=1775430 RepID=UPI000B1DD902|nr:glycoside hydrolase family 3 N-terminal domain-containing protein [Flammeovirga sp. SJP92]